MTLATRIYRHAKQASALGPAQYQHRNSRVLSRYTLTTAPARYLSSSLFFALIESILEVRYGLVFLVQLHLHAGHARFHLAIHLCR